jgi:hypothetical protein
MDRWVQRYACRNSVERNYLEDGEASSGPSAFRKPKMLNMERSILG